MSDMPPPPKPASKPESGDSLWTSATPLRNSDFRKLLETPRHPSQGGATPRQGGSSRGGQAGGRPAGSGGDGSKAQFKKPAPKKPAAKGKEEDDGQPKYRDRAKERREGINDEYADVEAELAAVLNSKGLLGGDGPDSAAAKALAIEQSKFLGGDMKHTHLVKGLDFALLQKERAKQAKEREEAAAAERAAARSLRREDLKISHPMARALFDTLFNPPRAPRVAEMFHPRRMAFVFEFDSEEAEFNADVPTTLRRSKADCPQPRETVLGSADSIVTGRVAAVLAYVKAGGKKLRKKERDEVVRSMLSGADPAKAAAAAAAPTTAAPTAPGLVVKPGPALAKKPATADDDDDDIFGDAGTDYKAVVKKKEGAAVAAAAPGPSGRPADGSYFGARRDALADVPVPAYGDQPTPAGRAADDMELDEEGEIPGPAPGPALPPPPAAAATWGAYGASGYAGAGYMDADAYAAQLAAQQHAAGPSGYYGAAGGAASMGAGAYGGGDKYGGEEAKWRVRRKPGGAAGGAAAGGLLGGDDDEAYGELFPEAVVFGGPRADSDEEDGGKGNKAVKTRFDFATEEEYNEYKSEQEANPKAKGGDGRRAARALENRGKQKLDNQLNKIERIFEEKGFGNAGAFAKPEATPSRRPAPVEDSVQPGAKKRRI